MQLTCAIVSFGLSVELLAFSVNPEPFTVSKLSVPTDVIPSRLSASCAAHDSSKRATVSAITAILVITNYAFVFFAQASGTNQTLGLTRQASRYTNP